MKIQYFYTKVKRSPISTTGHGLTTSNPCGLSHFFNRVSLFDSAKEQNMDSTHVPEQLEQLCQMYRVEIGLLFQFLLERWLILEHKAILQSHRT